MSVDRMVEVLQRQDPPLSARQLGQVAARIVNLIGKEKGGLTPFWSALDMDRRADLLEGVDEENQPQQHQAPKPAEELEPAEEPKPAKKGNK